MSSPETAAIMTTEERFTRIETILERFAEHQEQQDETLATLVDSHIKLADSLDKLAGSLNQTQMQVQAVVHAVEQLSNRTVAL